MPENKPNVNAAYHLCTFYPIFKRISLCPIAFHIVALVIAASYNTTLVVKSALGSYLGATDYYTEWSEANENLDAVYR